MSAALALKPKLRVEDYLLGERISPVRHEYVAGEVYAMAGASEEHNVVSGNIFAALHGHLRGKKCRAFMNDMKVKIWINHDLFYYPDVMVVCDPDDDDRYFKHRPTVLIEVLSPETRRIDEQEKLLSYLRLESLQEYVLVEQDTLQVMIFRRTNDWNREVIAGADAVLHLAALGFTLPLKEIYEGVHS